MRCLSCFIQFTRVKYSILNIPHTHAHACTHVYTNPKGSMTVGQWFTAPAPTVDIAPTRNPATPPLTRTLGSKDKSA